MLFEKSYLAFGSRRAESGVDMSDLVTKSDLTNALAQLEIRLMKWAFAMLAGQGAIIVALLKLL